MSYLETVPSKAPTNGKDALPRLLLVDDEADLLEVIARRLRRRGFEVETAPGASEAQACLATQDFDLVLLDHNMPEMSGMELLALLRQTHSATDLPVIMLTAQSDTAHVVRALDMGANDYITKPLEFEVACARIRTQLTRKSAEKALQLSEQRYQLAGQSTNEGLWDWDLIHGRVFYSDRWKAILGLSEQDLGCHPEAWLDRVHRQDCPRLQSELEAHWNGSQPTLRSEHRILHQDGSFRWVTCSGLCQRDAQGKPLRMAGSITDITEDKVKDALTGLGNRLHFTEHLSRIIQTYRQTDQRDHPHHFAVLFLDLDRFKYVNDTLGHAAGDQLLSLLARRLKSGTRSVTLARFGGDEFAVLLEGLTTPAEAGEVAKRLQQKLSEPYSICDREVFITVSIGIAFGATDTVDVESILRDADVALYRAKHAGRARVEVFDEHTRQEVLTALALENDLRRALALGEISVHYQPQILLRENRIIGFEALARWNSATRGLVPTLEFIALAEKTGLIVPIGEWVLREACRQMRVWQLSAADARDLRISVNLSAWQLQHADIVDVVESVIAETGIAPHHLCLELTESTFFANPEAATNTLQRLKAVGVQLELDDFGTGYSSLSCLGKLPLDGLKMDCAFTAKLVLDSDDAVVSSILELADRLGLHVVAEGLETEKQVTLLSARGCKIGQGFHFAKPMPPEGVEHYLKGLK